MRKGAFTTGSMVCNSIPVDIRTTQLVPGTGLRFRDGRGRPFVPSFIPPLHVNPLAAEGGSGQPKKVFTRVLYWVKFVCNCEVRIIGSVPISTKGAMATGPAMVMRY